MQANLHYISLPPQILVRGFWLYVWKIRLPNLSDTHYVGMTGDTGSLVAQSPFNRVSAHLGSNERSNPIRRYLTQRGVDAEGCHAIDFAAYGPLYEVPVERDLYLVMRGKVAAMEKELWLFLHNASFDLLNQCPPCNFSLDQEVWKSVRSAFANHFAVDS